MWLSQHVLKDPTGADDDQWSEETREECEGGKGHKGRTTAQTTHNGAEIISKLMNIFSKIQIFWEGHKISKNHPILFDIT